MISRSKIAPSPISTWKNDEAYKNLARYLKIILFEPSNHNYIGRSN